MCLVNETHVHYSWLSGCAKGSIPIFSLRSLLIVIQARQLSLLQKMRRHYLILHCVLMC